MLGLSRPPRRWWAIALARGIDPRSPRADPPPYPHAFARPPPWNGGFLRLRLGAADPPRGYRHNLPQNGDVEHMLSRLPPARGTSAKRRAVSIAPLVVHVQAAGSRGTIAR